MKERQETTKDRIKSTRAPEHQSTRKQRIEKRREIFYFLLCLLLLGCEKPYKEPSSLISPPLTRITDDKALDNFCSVSPNGQYIAFSSNKEKSFDLYIKDINEKAIIQRTSGSEDDLWPSFSPDGSKICFSSNRFGSFDIFVMDTLKAGEITQITFDKKRDEIFPSFSFEGDKILFTSLKENKNPVIMAISLKTGLITEITDGFFARFSPNGEKIIFNRQNVDDVDIWMVDIDGGDCKLIFHNEEFNCLFPSLSPTGGRIVYSSCSKGRMRFGYKTIGDIKDLKMDIRSVAINGRNDIKITGDCGVCLFPFWSSDGFIYFSSLREDNVDIFRVSGPKEIIQKAKDRIPEEIRKVKKVFPKPKEVEPEKSVVTTRDNVTIWSYPGKNVITKVNKGTRLIVISSKKWYIKVLLPDGRTGWVSSFFVE
ncbi:MAG: SH3 domain-containing protein [bacterium]